jgi:hypothetical protein
MKFYQTILGGLVVLGGISLTGCGQQTVITRQVPLISNVSSSVEEVPTVGQDVMKEWKTYRDEKLGIEVQYPAGLKIEPYTNRLIENASVNVTSTTGATLSFELHGYEKTNLREATITGEYAKLSQEECLKMYNGLKSMKSPQQIVSAKVQDGITLYKIDEQDAAAGSRYHAIIYAVPKNGYCFTANLVLHSVERMNYDEAERPTEYDPAPFIDTFEKMTARVKFLK